MAPKKKGRKAELKTEEESKAQQEEPAKKEPAKEEKEEPAKKEPAKEEKEEPAKKEPAKEEKEEAGDAKVEEKGEEKEEAGDAKIEEKEEECAQQPAEEEEPKEPKEKEQDSPPDTRKKVAVEAVAWNMAEASLNVMPSSNGRLLMALSEGGFQYLVAGARSTVGLKGGRYMFEAKIVESLSPVEAHVGGRAPMPRQLLRIGFSLGGSPVLLGDGEDSIFFDSEGMFVGGRQRLKVSQRFNQDEILAVLLNLDGSSPNCNTVSLFRDGERVSEPQALPEPLHGKVLFPTVSYRNATVQVNFGPVPMCALPFSCRMVKDAAAEDAEVAKVLEPKDGKHEVLFPVGLPDKGVFDWADQFLARNPNFTELSDRKIAEWATKSGLWRQRSNVQGVSNDKPDLHFGLPQMDDGSVRRVIAHIAPALRRDYLVMELGANLLAAERKELLSCFGAPHFRKTAVVVMGEPSEAHKQVVRDEILSEKKAKQETERKRKAELAERRRLLEEKRRKADEARKAAQQKKAGAEEAEETKDEAAPQKEEEEGEEALPEPELTEEEQKQWFRKSTNPDISSAVLARTYASFTLPGEEEGFDEIRYEWQAEQPCKALLRDFVLENKRTQRVEDLQVSDWFKEHLSKWQKVLQDWRNKEREYKDPAKRRAAQQRKLAELKKKEEEENKEGNGDEEKDGKEENGDTASMEINAEEVDVMSVEDVMDLGNGEPLFANFAFEDWTMLSARYEIHLLLHAFRKAMDDPDRAAVSEQHLGFYYTLHYKKPFNLKNFGTASLKTFVDLMKDTVALKEDGFLETRLAEDAELALFVKHTEEHRRERERRVDAGDETAKLNFPSQQPQQWQPQQPQRQQQQQLAPGAPFAAAQKRPYAGGAPAQHFPAAKRPRPAYAGYGGGYGGRF